MVAIDASNLLKPQGAEHSGSDARRNNLGVLRLALASLVVFTHSAELMDGDASRDLLQRLTGTTTFSALAVDGFFLISGYLIVKSWLGAPRISDFLTKRALRIVPGYVVALLLSVLAVLTLASAGPVNVAAQSVQTLRDLAQMSVPASVSPLRFAHHAAINGSLWTIRWEAGCYALAALMGLAGLTRRRWPWVVLFLLSVADVFRNDVRGHIYILVPQVQAPRFAAFFAAGALFYLYRDRIRFDRRAMALAAAGLIVSMLHTATVEIGLATFGAYLLFAAAFARLPRSLRLEPQDDVSYGLYLYAWPIQQLLLLFIPGISLVAHIALSLILSLGMGFLSWRLVESPAMSLLRRKAKPREALESNAVRTPLARAVVSIATLRPRSVGQADERPREGLSR